MKILKVESLKIEGEPKENRWLNLYETTYQNRSGKECTWRHASRKSPGVTQPDAVIIVPFYIDAADQTRVVLINEFRIPVKDFEIGFPAGLIDPNETPEITAARELLEETGLKLDEVLKISPAVYSSAGLSDESVVFVFCRCSGVITNNNQTDDENITVLSYTAEQIPALLESGQKLSAKAYPILLLFHQLDGKIPFSAKI